MRKISIALLLAVAACDPQTATETKDDAKAETKVEEPKAEEKAPEAKADLRADLEASVAACVAEPVCMASLEADEHLLQSCPWYKAVGCGVVVAAAATACVVTDGEACAEALEAVSAIGCCDCLPSGKVRDMCKAI